MWKGLKFKERDLETYGEDTQEWKEAQVHYGNIKKDLEREISLGIGFVGSGEALNDWGEDREITQHGEKENAKG